MVEKIPKHLAVILASIFSQAFYSFTFHINPVRGVFLLRLRRYQIESDAERLMELSNV